MSIRSKSPAVQGEITTAAPIYLDAAQPIEVRINDLLARLTLEEKISLIHADSKFSTAGVPRLGIPKRWLTDGPHGIREEVGPDTWKPAGRTDDFATYMPVLIALAATWNPDLANLYGQTLGQEARQRGKDILLGPGVNILRTPLNGRNYEYLGEDPFLVGQLAAEYVRGVQSQDVAACVKHFAANNQETLRNTIDVQVDDRALNEIYLPAFKAAVQDGGALCVMSAYNRFRGEYCSQSDYLLNTILKKQWAFKGIVISDWDAVHDTLGAACGGLDLEMGTEQPYAQFYFAQPFLEIITRGEISQQLLDDKVRRTLRVMFATRILDAGRVRGSINTKEHQLAALHVAGESIVLLKNDANTLPLNGGKINRIAVIGENSIRHHAYGGDSARIKAFYEITPLDGLLRRAALTSTITFATGYAEKPAEDPKSLADRAVEAAGQADVAIVFAGLSRTPGGDTEAFDRKDMRLPFGQDDLIVRVAAVNPRTIVVLISGSPVEMPWVDKVPAIVQAWYPGMEGGNAIAAVLFGDVNPSGKLPCTFPKRLEDSPAHALAAYPGDGVTVNYAEGILVGYRWFDTKKIAPLFPFGHGLSYTEFEYSNFRVTSGEDGIVHATFDITNTGARDGAEVAQLYVHQRSASLPRPEKELKAFRKVTLSAGAKQSITFTLNRHAFSFFDPSRGWVAELGEFTVFVGSSSADLRLQADFILRPGMADPKMGGLA
jgi:beta-glucosidase